MSAQIIDLQLTADIRRATRETGGEFEPGMAMPLRVRIGSYVYDFASRMSGWLTHFNHDEGQTKAVLLCRGCSVAANLTDLIPALPPKETD